MIQLVIAMYLSYMKDPFEMPFGSNSSSSTDEDGDIPVTVRVADEHQSHDHFKGCQTAHTTIAAQFYRLLFTPFSFIIRK